MFATLHDFLLDKGYNLFELLRRDYYNNFTIRPHGFWESSIGKKENKQLLYQIGNDKAFLHLHKLTRKIVEKQITIDPTSEDGKYVLTLIEAHPNTEDKHKEFVYKFNRE